MTFAFAPAIVLVVVGIKTDSAHIPHLWLIPADPIHQCNKYVAISHDVIIIN